MTRGRTVGANGFSPMIHEDTPEVQRLFGLGVTVSELSRRFNLSRHRIRRMLSCVLPSQQRPERPPDNRLAQMIPSSEVQ